MWRAGGERGGEERPQRGAPPPADLARQAEVLVERRDVAVGGEEVVVVALQAVAAARVERRRLPTEPRPALVDVDPVAVVGQVARGGETGHAGAEDGDAQAHSSAGVRGRGPTRSSSSSTLTVSRTTYSGRRLTSS